MKKYKRSKYWDIMCDILEKEFPKGECQGRGSALVMLAKIEFLLLFGKKEFNDKFKYKT